MNMFGKRFQNELDMITSALKSEKAEKELIIYLKPSVNKIIDEYIIEKKLIKYDRKLLEKAAWTHFHLALKKYMERVSKMVKVKNDVYYFVTYFNWYVRQGILEYLNSNKS